MKKERRGGNERGAQRRKGWKSKEKHGKSVAQGGMGGGKNDADARTAAATTAPRWKFHLDHTRALSLARVIACRSHFLGRCCPPPTVPFIPFGLSLSTSRRPVLFHHRPALRSSDISSEKLNLRLTANFLRLFRPSQIDAAPPPTFFGPRTKGWIIFLNAIESSELPSSTKSTMNCSKVPFLMASLNDTAGKWNISKYKCWGN